MVEKKANYSPIKIYTDTKEALDALEVKAGGVSFNSYDAKIKHLLWFYSNYVNNNHRF